MRIGLIGINMYPKYLNFACGLHTYAFQQFLLQHDIDNTVIDYKPVYFSNFDMRHPSDYYEKKYKKLEQKKVNTPEAEEQRNETLKDLKTKISDWKPLYAEREVRYDKFKKFIDENYIKTEEKYDSDLLEVKDPGFDCYMCVTDVIWNLLPDHTYDRGFFLASKAMEGKPKISYAASRGVRKPYTDEDKELFFHYIDDIDDISVREESLKDFIEENSDKKATVVLDPVLLHGKEFWRKISVKPQEEKYLVLYYVMEKAADTVRRAVEYAKEHDLQIIELSDRPVKGGRVKDDDVKHISRYDVSMEEWLGYIEHAECIFTNSFHGCCFSILFEKIFFVGSRNGDKVPNFLNMFGLQDRKMPPKDESLESMPKTIDYEPVMKILDDERIKSQTFVLNAIKDAENRIADGSIAKQGSYEDYRKNLKYPVKYFSKGDGITVDRQSAQTDYKIDDLASNKLEYFTENEFYQNNGHSVLDKNLFRLEGFRFTGWSIRIQIDNKWFWCMSDGSLKLASQLNSIKTKGKDSMVTKVVKFLKRRRTANRKQVFADGANIPYIPVNRIRMMVAEANWQSDK